MNNYCYCVIILLVSFASLAIGADILVFIPLVTKSHLRVLEPLIEELSTIRGHRITYVGLAKAPSKAHSNVEYIHLESSDYFLNTWTEWSTKTTINSLALSAMLEPVRVLNEACEKLFNDQAFQTLQNELSMKKRVTYDAVITVASFNECHLKWLNSLGAPLILVSPCVLMPHIAWELNIPYPLSYVPTITKPFSSTMNFQQRVINHLTVFIHSLFYKLYMGPENDAIAAKYVDHSLTSLEVVGNASLILVNSHVSLDEAKPTMPFVIDVGGMHCRDGKRVAKIFEEFVNSSGEDGFIVMSMGSVVQGNRLPKEFTSLFQKVFSSLKQKVIWKFEDSLEDISPNVMLSKWIPQQDLMAHPKCRLAITHGGLLSLQEVVYHGVPLLGVPLGADRDFNINQAVNKGFALILDWTTASAEETLEKINYLIYDKKYKSKAEELSRLTRDRPHPPVETAAFWVEYVIRHKGAPHLKNAGAQKLNLIQYLGIDVLAFIIGIISAVIVVLTVIVKMAINKCLFPKSKLKIN